MRETLRNFGVRGRGTRGPRLAYTGMVIAAAISSGCATQTAATGSHSAAGPAGGAWPWPIASTVADTLSTSVIAPGVRLHSLVRNSGPLRAYVLDIDLSSCVGLRALKSGNTAVGRATTTALFQSIAPADAPLAAVNADFFLFAPPGVPVGALVRDGVLITGPVGRPVLAFDNTGKPYIGALTVTGTITGTGTASRTRVAVTSWNRPSVSAAGIVDAAWGQPLDSVVRPTARMLVPLGHQQFRVMALPPLHRGQAMGDTLMLVGKTTAVIPDGEMVQVTTQIAPIAPRHAVGGFPLLLRDSLVVPSVDSAGAVSFRGLNPRTAAGIADNGRRLLLVVIDGRQPGYSMGTSTRATAELLRDLGARDALNLDGGGSSAMVVRDATGGSRVVNKPSDATGERPVGDALGVVGKCR